MKKLIMLVVTFIILTILTGFTTKEKTYRITKYTPVECPSRYTASGKPFKEGYVAVSKDIEAEHKLKFGDWVHIKGIGKYRFYDRTSPRLKRTIDIAELDFKDAINFGVKRKEVKFSKGKGGDSMNCNCKDCKNRVKKQCIKIGVFVPRKGTPVPECPMFVQK